MNRDHIVYVVLAIVILYLLFNVFSKSKSSPSSSKGWTVYGTNSCGWTRKQLALMDDKKIPYTFVDCEDGKCPSDISGFPTLVDSDGNKTVGFNSL